MRKQIQKPQNWQDFESLCKMLFGGLWKIPNEIKKNGRNGQSQKGIDLYGSPKGVNSYWGVQCKVKDDYSNSKLTIKEITDEYDEAKNFTPQLSKFILATSANKDTKIEEFVRTLNIKSQNEGGFEVQLLCWEDIADLIEKNRRVFDYWMGSNQFVRSFNVDVHLKNNLEGKTSIIRPVFYRKIQQFLPNTEFSKMKSMRATTQQAKRQFSKKFGFGEDKNNVAVSTLSFTIENTGAETIEDWGVQFTILGKHKPVEVRKNFGCGLDCYPDTKPLDSKVYTFENFKPLVQGKKIEIEIPIIPIPEWYNMEINWRILARNFSESGEILVKVAPKFIDETEIFLVEDESLAKNEILSIREHEYEY